MSLYRRNRLALAGAVLACLLIILVLFLPAFHFNATVFTKRSGNTFVGDERYMAAMNEVNQAVADFESRGIHTKTSEEIIERVNSKGETTSLIIFRVNSEILRTAWDFIVTRFPSAFYLIGMCLCVFLALFLCLIFRLRDLQTPTKRFPRFSRFLRKSAVVFAIIAMIMAVVFVLNTNVVMNRQIGLYASGIADAPPQSVLQSADRLIYDGAGGEETASMLKNTSSNPVWTWFLVFPPILLLILCCFQLGYDQIAHPLKRACLYAFVIIVSVVILYPYVVMATCAFRTDAEATDVSFQHMFPVQWNWGNLTYILGRGVLRYLLNSLIISTGATLLALLCGIPAAYAMARMRFKGRKIYMGFVIMSQMFSPVVLLVGISRLLLNLHMNDTLPGLVFINAAFNQAFAIWLLRGTFVAISPEMEQAACIDGCNSVTALLRVLLPMAAPGIVTTLIFVFINAWNEYTISTVVISSDINRPITVGLTQFAAFSMIQWNYLFASSLLATIPVVILFMLIEKHLVSGLTSGGVKG